MCINTHVHTYIYIHYTHMFIHMYKPTYLIIHIHTYVCMVINKRNHKTANFNKYFIKTEIDILENKHIYE